MDRQNSMSSLFAMGNEVAGGCEPAERKAIEKQLKGLMQRFDALTDGAQQRMLDLEQAMKVRVSMPNCTNKKIQMQSKHKAYIAILRFRLCNYDVFPT